MRIDACLYVGLSSRTNVQGADRLAEAIEGRGYELVPVEVSDILHLKSACTYLGGDLIAFLPGHLDESVFAAYRKIVVPRHEAHAANCLSVNGTVLVPSAAPATRAQVEEAGFPTQVIDISEYHKVGGGLTCSSIIF